MPRQILMTMADDVTNACGLLLAIIRPRPSLLSTHR
jgi:hypothetical protein